MIKTLFLDIDGTLLNRAHILTENTKVALKEAHDKGVIITLCSGRARDGLLEITEQLCFKPYLATLNGAYILDNNGNVINEHYFEYETLEKLEELRKECGVGLLYFPEGSWGANSDDEEYKDELSIVKRPGIQMNILEYAKSKKIHKYLTVGDSEKNKVFIQRAKKLLPELMIVPSSSRYVEVNTPQCDKGSAVKDICDYLNCDIENTYCFGDFDNDIAMFKVCRHPIAMANAVDKIKALAEHITLSCDEDGVAYGIRKWVI